MRTSAAGLELIKTFEGMRETAVRLPDGRWTIGYGHVRTAREGLTITEKDAHDLLVHDLRPVEVAISSMIFAPLMQSQFDALVSLAFNISLGQFRESEIVRCLNAGDYLAAASGFDLWRKARLHGRVMVVDALVRRRAAEKTMFLEHPSGPPSAPTPMVTPELDFTADGPYRREPLRQPMADDFDQDDAPRSSPAPANDIAEAVRRLAERTQEAITPVRELALPPGASVAPPEPPPAPPPPEPHVDPVVVAEAPPASPPAAPMSAEELARASRTVAERVARILNGVQMKIDKVESVEEAAPVTVTRPAPRSVEVREGLPDFDLPGERMQREADARARKLIDDTEVMELDRDPAVAFAEAERKAKMVNGQAKRIGPISGRVLVLAPWIVMLALSVLGFVVGAVDTLKGGSMHADVPRVAGTMLVVFGLMTVMSLYFIFWKRSSDET